MAHQYLNRTFLIFNYATIFLLALHIIANHGFPGRLIEEVSKIEGERIAQLERENERLRQEKEKLLSD